MTTTKPPIGSVTISWEVTEQHSATIPVEELADRLGLPVDQVRADPQAAFDESEDGFPTSEYEGGYSYDATTERDITEIEAHRLEDFLFHVTASMCVHVYARDEDAAREAVGRFDGVDLNAAVTVPEGGSELLVPALVTETSLRSIIAAELLKPDGTVAPLKRRPGDGAFLASPEADNLRKAVRAFRRAAEGETEGNDAEHDAALDLIYKVEALMGEPASAG
ncbi:hypothetical protein GCM10022221_68270 [Actinocorallia aurea]